MIVTQGYTFDDLLLVPKHSKIKTRDAVSLDVDLGKGVKLKCPIVSANMKDVTETAMAKTIGEIGGLPILHRFCSIEKQLDMLTASQHGYYVGCSVGVKEEDYVNARKLIDAGCKVICVDVAHGDHILSLEMVERIAKSDPHVLLIAGNVATSGGAKRLHEVGADVIKCGIGGGSLCTTRIETGNGVPQMTALADIHNSSFFGFKKKFKIIADGGIRRGGDCVKALCYSDAVMLGGILAGTDETPGGVMFDPVTRQAYKQYAGSSTHKTNHVEGIVARVKCKGRASDVINNLLEGIRSGLSYQGCENLDELKEDPIFVQITNAGLIESHPHAK